MIITLRSRYAAWLAVVLAVADLAWACTSTSGVSSPERAQVLDRGIDILTAALPGSESRQAGASLQGEICYASGNQLWLRNLSAGIVEKLTSEKVTSATYHLPQWIDHDHILFIRSETLDGTKTQVGMLDVRSKRIKWFSGLAGADSVGYNSGKIDYVKVAANTSDSDVVDVYFGRYDLGTSRAASNRAYSSWGSVHYARIYSWPRSSMRILPLETSDVSDQVVVYDMTSGKCVTPGILSDNSKRKLFGGGELRISHDADHPFRWKPITCFGPSRSVISGSITLSESISRR